MNSPNKSTTIDDLIKNHSQKNAETVEQYLVPQRNSENHARRSGNLERHHVLKIEDRVQGHTCVKISKAKRDLLYLWKHSTWHYRRSQEVSRAKNLQSIHHVSPWSSQVSIEEYPKKSTLWNISRITENSKKTRDYLGSEGKMSCGTIVERDPEDEKNQLRMHGTRIATNQHGRI